MTAEAVVMNKSCVALAADSTVSISAGRQGFKTFDSVNKVFELQRGAGVGVMVYGNAELNRVPWETLIKRYRSAHLGVEFDTIEEYYRSFSAFLEGGRLRILDDDTDVLTLLDACYFHALAVHDYVKNRMGEWSTAQGSVNTGRLRAVADDSLDVWEATLERAEPGPWAAEAPAELIASRYKSELATFVREMFRRFELPRARQQRIAGLLAVATTKLYFEPQESGLVIAGFGRSEIMPALHSCSIAGRIAGVLRTSEDRLHRITPTNPSFIETFAQDEEGRGFLSGTTPTMRRRIDNYWTGAVDRFPDRITERLSADVPELADEGLRREVARVATELVRSEVDDFTTDMQEFQSSNYTAPMNTSITALPKDEVGILAESLVNLTLLKQRISVRGPASVGGPIDVALISPGDGLVWLKRKHYFSADLNPTWAIDHQAVVRRDRMRASPTEERL